MSQISLFDGGKKFVFDKPNRSQLHKQVGNSIVKQVLMAIFGEMNERHYFRRGL